jgi:hypothetical protein
MRAAAATLAVMFASLGACQRRAPFASCDENLHGVYVTPAGARWMLLDNGPTLELYPLFDDLVVEGAPRLIDIARGEKLQGHVKRRYMRRALACEGRAPATITACKDDTLQFVIGEVASPLSYEPCAWPQQAPTRVELWRRD